MQKLFLFLMMLLPVTGFLCACGVSHRASVEIASGRPLQLTAQPVVERRLMSSLVAHRNLKDNFEVRCVITNISSRTERFHTSRMAEWMDWESSDARLFVPPFQTISVAIGTVVLRPGEQYAYTLPLSVHHVKSDQTITFRVGMRMSDEVYTLWSNTMSVRVQPEWTVPSAVVAAENP